jgi:hypothetical protein
LLQHEGIFKNLISEETAIKLITEIVVALLKRCQGYTKELDPSFGIS